MHGIKLARLAGMALMLFLLLPAALPRAARTAHAQVAAPDMLSMPATGRSEALDSADAAGSAPDPARNQHRPTPTPVPPTATAPPTVPPTATATAPATASPTPTGRLYGLVGQGGLGESIDTAKLAQDYAGGVRGRLVELGWDVLQPTGPNDWNTGAIQQFQARIDAFTATGPDTVLYLDLGIHYAPAWVSAIDPLMDQYGDVWQAHGNGGGANVYWSPTVRAYAAAYIQRVFSSLDFHGRLWAVRVGTYFAELAYPRLEQSGRNHAFWAFDANAQAQSPVPGWRPGQASPNGEAQRFYDWYVDKLADTFNFMLYEIRRYYAGYVAPVTPGVGIWDGTAQQLISHNLDDSTEMCCYGTGNYWQRLFAEFPGADQGVINWCSSVGDGSGDDGSANWWQWSSAKQLAYLAHQNDRQIYGENPGRNPYNSTGGADPRTTMVWDFATLRASGYLGLMWVRQADLDQPAYASLTQYAGMIAQYR